MINKDFVRIISNQKSRRCLNWTTYDFCFGKLDPNYEGITDSIKIDSFKSEVVSLGHGIYSLSISKISIQSNDPKETEYKEFISNIFDSREAAKGYFEGFLDGLDYLKQKVNNG